MTEGSGLPHFPPSAQTAPTSEALRAYGLSLRQAQKCDVPWLRQLYASTRAAELTAIPWSDTAKTAFLHSQFDLQHRHYLAQHPLGEWWVVQKTASEGAAAQSVGRLYLADEDAKVWIVDICLMPDWRGRGLGSALLQQVQRQAAKRSLGVGLHVAHENLAAIRLYQRLGFVAVHDAGTHWRMHWSPETMHADDAPRASGDVS